MKKAHPDPENWWRHRTIQAYLAFVGLFGLMIVAITIAPEQIEASGPLLTALAWVFAIVVFLFTGSAVAEKFAEIKGGLR